MPRSDESVRLARASLVLAPSAIAVKTSSSMAALSINVV